jgi:hypothetical protein
MILDWLMSIGRKSILVDGYGRIRMERYDLLWKEEESDGRPWPNIWLHHMPGPESPDAKDDPHKHPWSTITIILKGGYLEVVNRAIRRLVTRCAILSYRSNHRIETVLPGTWTIFAHWVRRQPWTFHFEKCETLCQACSEKGAQCFKASHPVMELGELFGMGGGALQWVRSTPEIERRLAAMRRALRIKGVSPNRDEASTEFKRRLVA